MPCLPLIVYNFLDYLGVFSQNGTSALPRSVFLSFGIILYSSFSDALSKLTTSLYSNSTTILRGGVSPNSVTLSIFFELICKAVVRVSVFVALTSLRLDLLNFRFLYLPIFILASILLGFSVGLFFAVLSLKVKDLMNIVPTIVFYLLFASGVFAELSGEGLLIDFLKTSPLYILITESRNLIFFSQNLSFSYSYIPPVLLLISGSFFFNKYSRKFVSEV